MEKSVMLSSFLLTISLLVNVFNKSGYRALICFIAIFTTIAHTLFFYDAVSYNYYGTASIACLLTILGISLFTNSPLSTDIQILNLIGIFVNVFGYYQYQSGAEPDIYNNIMIVLIITEFIRLMVNTDRDRVHDVLGDSGSNNVHFNVSGSGSANTSGHK